ncbi:CDP-alcohol phosphatidyltransferase [Planctomycetes bacterium Pla163]|uniref:CDP-alcohol phosphatidyltransferase n=1 Tax=Rohdeia mirabilis TaxID=2528008 RepID=A0A518CZM6_9BACT|nr:CDP-alcohol phosphatidyltransferase [Planctomycetes bacterium Pla163]
MKRVHLLPNILTLANAFCGLLALAKGIDALAHSGGDPLLFYRKVEVACALIFTGMVFDVLDGFAARLTRSASAFGAQLDSFADALTFGVAPALLAKILIEHEEALHGSFGNARVHFLAAAAFALMAILRLVRFNLEDSATRDGRALPVPSADDEADTASDGPPPRARRKDDFSGLPSPAAAGAVASIIWLYLILAHPELEANEGTPTPTRRFLQGIDYDPTAVAGLLEWMPRVALMVLPLLGLLMVTHVRYPHFANLISFDRLSFFQLVGIVFAAFLLYLAPVPVLFLAFNGFVVLGLFARLRDGRNGGSNDTPSVPRTDA